MRSLTRRTVMAGGAAMAIAGAAGADEARAAAWLQAWDREGTHRTATTGDQAGADWLAQEAKTIGFDAEFETFTLERIDPVDAYLQIEDTRIEGVPVFDAPGTHASGLTGTLGAADTEALIGVAEFSPFAVYTGAYQQFRRRAPHAALVIVCKGESPGLALLDAEHFRQFYGAPALQVPSEARDLIFDAARRGATAKLLSFSRRTATDARNLVVTIKGTDPSRRTVVVMTPRSSWWQSTAERGGGLVCWLESLRALRANPPACDVIFTANSGHELGHIGLDDFMARRLGWERSALWVHYGANLGAAGGELSIQSADDALRDSMAKALRESGKPPDTIAPKTLAPNGESRDIHRAGGRYVTLVGTNPLFHLPQDRWPDSVDATAVVRIAEAATRVVVEVTR